MLGGNDPLIIFQFSKLAGLIPEDTKIPIISQIPELIEQPPIPIYFGQDIQSAIGVFIDSEDKNVDIDTSIETKSDGSEPDVTQKGVGTTVAINLIGKRDSPVLAILSAMVDQVFEKLTSKEYAITYMNGPVTVFRGLLSSYQVNQNSTSDLLTIKIELTRGQKQPNKEESLPNPGRFQGAVPL